MTTTDPTALIPRRIQVPASYMRGGTSKGVFMLAKDLPADDAERDRFLLAMMGSPDRYGRQLNGMGGGISSLSKVIVVGPGRDGADLTYLHGQVQVDRSSVDYSANCGNLSSAVAQFAAESRLISLDASGLAEVRMLNLNANTMVTSRFPTRDGRPVFDGDFEMPGVGSGGARVELSYDLDGADLWPSANCLDRLAVDERLLEASLPVATLPCVFVEAAALDHDVTAAPDEIDADRQAMRTLEHVRRAGARAMGMVQRDEDASAASPKIGIVGAPRSYRTLDGSEVHASDCDLLVRMISMGKTHKAVPLTAAMCLAASSQVHGSIGARLRSGSGRELRLGTPSGVISVAADLVPGDSTRVLSTSVFASANMLMSGCVHGHV